MTIPFYKGFAHPGSYPSDGHAGLWYDKFVRGWHNANKESLSFASYESLDSSGKKTTISPASQWVGTLHHKNVGNSDLLHDYLIRMLDLLTATGGHYLVATTDWRFVTGMGKDHPVENGFAWHPTLGVPYLTGAAVKGMLRAWCEQWSSSFPGADKAKILRSWFGPSIEELTSRQNRFDPSAGGLIFFDALPIRPVRLQADVMTPHYKDWYEKGGEGPEEDGSNVPADWHSPVPVPFLTVAEGHSFLFAVAARPASSIDLSKVIAELYDALEWIGAGAKTAAGYGHMSEDREAKKKIEVAFARHREVMRREEEKSQRRRDMEKMTPLQRDVTQLLLNKADPSMKDYVLLLKKLEEEFWPDKDNQRAVALKIKEMMQDDDVWREESSAKRPDKDGVYQRTLRVLKYLRQ